MDKSSRRAVWRRRRMFARGLDHATRENGAAQRTPRIGATGDAKRGDHRSARANVSARTLGSSGPPQRGVG